MKNFDIDKLLAVIFIVLAIIYGKATWLLWAVVSIFFLLNSIHYGIKLLTGEVEKLRDDIKEIYGIKKSPY